MEASASVRFVRITPQKARRAIDLIRGRQVDEARRILKFSTLGASRTLAKALDSAIANAEQRPGVVAQNLVVDRAWVDEGPTLKRFTPRARGRAGRINKRTAHITIVVDRLADDRLEVVQNREARRTAAGRRRAASGGTAASRQARVQRSRERAESLKDDAVETTEVEELTDQTTETAAATEAEENS